MPAFPYPENKDNKIVLNSIAMKFKVALANYLIQSLNTVRAQHTLHFMTSFPL
jgi:hypothetical protein